MSTRQIYDLLAEIESGKRHFSPTQEPAKIDRYFQSTAKALKAMESAGLIGKVSERKSGEIYLEVMVIDGLTHQGEQMLARANAGVLAKAIGWCGEHASAIVVGVIVAVVSGLLLATCGVG